MSNTKNVLVITNSPWNDDKAFGNTLSNFFKDWSDYQFYNICCSTQLPENLVCENYFLIDERQLISNFIKPKKNGKEIKISKSEKDSNRESKDIHGSKINIINKIYQKKWIMFYFAREFIWKFGKWNNKKLDQFLLDKHIDIIFSVGADPIYLQEIIQYCKYKTHAKLVLFFADDVYNYKSYKPLKFLYQKALRNKLKQTVVIADLIYGASEPLCKEYGLIFQRSIKPLYKGCDFEKCKIKESTSNPISIVYAGNLFYGRDQILMKLSKAIDQINKNYQKQIFFLKVFTNSEVNEAFKNEFNKVKTAKLFDPIPYSEVKKELQKAEIVLFVESFNKNEIKKTKLSFSTKIIDCIQSGSCMLAIGPSEIASIKYLKESESVIVVDDIRSISITLNKIVENPEILINKAKSLMKFGYENHDSVKNQKRIKNDFEKLMNYFGDTNENIAN